MAKETKPTKRDVGDLPISPTLRRFAEMITSIPGGEEDGQESILAAIMDAQTPEELNDAFEGLDDVPLCRTIVVSDLRKAKSSIAGNPLGFFLIVTAADFKTGEDVTFSTGSIAVVGALVKAYNAGWLPLKCEIVEAEHETAAGYRPHNLRVYGPPDTF